jgi:lipoyl synthase
MPKGALARRPSHLQGVRVAAPARRVLKLRLRQARLRTVCESARCPNQGECFSRPTAAFLILGQRCTRRCGFCAIAKGTPLPPDPGEPAAVAEAARELGLRHVVVTSVTRDDLADGGAGQFAATIHAVRGAIAGVKIEVLTPDFGGKPAAIQAVAEAGPDVFNHNLETVPGLYARVRPGADYRRSLTLLRMARALQPGLVTKSGLMLGLGETGAEVEAVLDDLLAAKVEALTLGQYLPPSRRHLPVTRYLEPEEFTAWAEKGRAKGFRRVFAGPLVRSSYHADELMISDLRR